MTTILGVKTGKDAEPEGIVLASDTQLTDYEGDKLTEKRTGYKLVSGSFWAIGYAGTTSSALIEFLGFLKGQKRYGSSEETANDTIAKAIKENSFDKVMYLNKENRKNGVENENLDTFLLAVNKPKLKIYTIDEFGSMDEVIEDGFGEYHSIGDGGKVDEYMKMMVSEGKIDLNNFGIDAVIRFEFGAMHKAESSITTGGPIDLIVLMKDSVKPYGKLIRDKLIEAEREAMNEIISRYVPPKEPEQPKQG